MNSIFQLLANHSEKKSNGYFSMLEFRTKSGDVFRGTLYSWKKENSSLVAVTTESNGRLIYIEIGSIESVKVFD